MLSEHCSRMAFSPSRSFSARLIGVCLLAGASALLLDGPAGAQGAPPSEHGSLALQPPDPTGSRALALQQEVLAAVATQRRHGGLAGTIQLHGVYNFSSLGSFHLPGAVGLSLLGTGPATTQLLFQGRRRGAPPTPPPPPELVHGAAGPATMLTGYRIYPNPMKGAAGSHWKAVSTPQDCQQACYQNASCVGAVYAGALCYFLPVATTFYPDLGFDSWSKVPVIPATGPPGGGSWSPQANGLIGGVNATDCVSSSLRRLSIDYDPKPFSLFCDPGQPDTDTCHCHAVDPSGGCEGMLGITLHFFNSSGMVAEDVALHAAPYMAVTSFNGPGGHTLRRVRFVPNAPGQKYVSERDGIHESDVRKGITVEDSEIFGQKDDFVNVHSTLLVVLDCDSDGRSCTVINPHVEPGLRDTTYGTNSLLMGAQPGDRLAFVAMVGAADPPPKQLHKLASAVLRDATRVTDPAVLSRAISFAAATHANNPTKVMEFCGADRRATDVWRLVFEDPLPPGIVQPTTLISIEDLSSAGAVLRNNTFNRTTAGFRFKSPNSLIASNTFLNEGCSGVKAPSTSAPSCLGVGFEITYLQAWFEGAAFISNISIQNNIFYYGAGFNMTRDFNPADTSNIRLSGNRFLPRGGG